jgi:hypothetical protein
LACGKKSESSWSRALPLGSYDLAAPVCGSTGAAPLYPAINYRVALFDFDDLTEHVLTVESRQVVETFRAKDCLVTSTHGIFRNYDGGFSARHDRKFTFEPAGCTLASTAEGTTYRIGPDYTDLLKDSSDLAEELPFEVTTEDDHTYKLKSQDLPDLNDLWSAYGCSKPDRLQIEAASRVLLPPNSVL